MTDTSGAYVIPSLSSSHLLFVHGHSEPMQTLWPWWRRPFPRISPVYYAWAVSPENVVRLDNSAQPCRPF
ncbi:hypothetical protein SCLCIDRAFT_1218924 [Scleroderma citrinum Foug A]|uniref:Uncharacterized protein n=1 Tax=Scleroderma citrinum Foug A TaxID=1036808 RepID=A0A0C2Z7Q0_9AGAM|nr:hypothetical protein SCLCIDRAFT_1218924 [Scleroderma citrinum Foug A]